MSDALKRSPARKIRPTPEPAHISRPYQVSSNPLAVRYSMFFLLLHPLQLSSAFFFPLCVSHPRPCWACAEPPVGVRPPRQSPPYMLYSQQQSFEITTSILSKNQATCYWISGTTYSCSTGIIQNTTCTALHCHHTIGTPPTHTCRH